MTKEEYRKKVWEVLKGYNDLVDIEDLEGLLEEIMSIEPPIK